MKETIASGLSREGLRRIAACTMLVDHIGATLFPGVLWLRCVGRLAFPIFAFFLGEGFRFTHSRRQYLLRLVLFALLSELPFNQMVYGRWIAPSGQNVLWTLALGLCAIACVQRAPSEPGLHSLFWYSAAAGCCLLGQLLHTADRFPQQLGDHRGAGPLRHRAGQHHRLFTLCPLSGAAGPLLFRHRRHLLFAPAGCPAGFAFPVLVDFVFFSAPFSAYTPVGGYNFPGISKKP